MHKHFLTAAKCTAAFFALVLSPVALGALWLAGYFVIDGVRALGAPLLPALTCVVLSAALLHQRRKPQPQG